MVSFQEISLQRPKTGEEGAYEMNDDGEIGAGDLGLTDEREIERYAYGPVLILDKGHVIEFRYSISESCAT